MLTDNEKILQASFPEIVNLEYERKKNILEEDARNGQKTIAIIKNNKKKYLHSKYNPHREVEKIVESLEIDDQSSIVFYGTGIGYHIQFILEKYKHLKCYIHEPIPELLNLFLANVNLKELNSHRIMGINTTLAANKLVTFIDRNLNNIKLVILPSHSRIYEQESEDFQTGFINLLKYKKTNLHTNYAFQKRWIINSLTNFPEVLNTPNILLEKEGVLKGKTAVLVAAGPSLNDEIENLREIKEKGLAYIFSVGSAINTLIHNGIHPDATCSYDPTEKNQMVFDLLKKENIKDIPLIFGTSVAFEVLEGYPGEKYHMITSQDSVAHYFLQEDSKPTIKYVGDAPSIALVTLELLSILGFNKIILVGQNFGYRGKERYSSGISYSSELSDEEIKNGIWVEGVNGKEILTNQTFNSMRNQMQAYIRAMPHTNIINTTKDGAYIEGTDYLELRSIIDNHLNERIVEKHWLKCKGWDYNQENLEIKLTQMDQSYEEAILINKKYKKVLKKIEKALKEQKFTKAEKLYIKLNDQLIKIEKNEFYLNLILPMNRVHYKILSDSIDCLNEELNSNKKGNRILKVFRDFITACEVDIELIDPMYKELRKKINKKNT